MKKITDFTTLGRVGYDELYAEMMKALGPVGDKFGITFKPKTARHASDYSNITVTAMVVTKDGQIITPEMHNFKELAQLYGMKPEDLGRKFMMNGACFKIVGLKTKSRTMPILCERTADGKRFKVGAETVASLLKTNPVAA